jgi:hypothetical protein
MVNRRMLLSGVLAIAGHATISRLQAAETGIGRDTVVRRFAELVRREYQDDAIGAALADRLLARLATGQYESADSATALAAALMQDVSAVTHDRHFHVLAGMHHGSAPSIRPGRRQSRPDPAWLAQMRSENFGLHGVEILDGNIGRIDLRRFYSPFDEVAARLGAAMELVADTRSLIIDLTRNIGGDPAGVAHLSSYFLAREPFVLNRLHWRSSGVEDFRTTAALPGPGYGEERPVIVAVSRDTFSAAEEFAYNLQALDRAVIVGQPTAGGANHAEMFPVGMDVVAFIPCARAENPVTGTNWEGDGVQPDVRAESDTIASEAHQEALRQTARKLSAGTNKTIFRGD